MEMKKNDWLATVMFQPSLGFQDFANNDITPENTSFLSREEYKKSNEVTSLFTDEKGKFDDSLFEKTYQSALSTYNTFANQKFENKIIETYQYDQLDYLAPIGSNKKNTTPILSKVSNPQMQSSGVETLFAKSKPEFSFREIAQNNKIKDSQTDKFLDVTPNEIGFFGTLFNNDTIVIAQWDEDGTHESNGRTIKHKKGENKLLEDGTGYYETLNNRDIYGKQVLKTFDVLSTDGSAWNTIDVFDSDGLDKSITGTIFKTVLTVAPMLIPYVGTVYGALTASNELTKLVPMLMKGINGIISNDNLNSDLVKKLNNIEGFGHRFGSSISDNSTNSMFTWENLGRLVEDTSMQLFQQKVIGSIPKYLSNVSDPTLRAQKVGRQLSLAYMSGTSSMDAYGAFKEAGADDRTAGLGMLSTMGAMYGLFNVDYFRDMLFRGTYLDETGTKAAVKSFAKATVEGLKTGAVDVTTAKGAANFVSKGAKSLANKLSTVSESKMLSRAVNEATEETFEEITSDAIKALYSGASALGIDMTNAKDPLDFKMTASDMLQRYSMSFLGGFIGGPVFELHNKWDHKLKTGSANLIQTNDNQTTENIINLIRNGQIDDIRRELSKLHKKGKLGDVNLSGKAFEEIKTENGVELKFLQSNGTDSQNDVVFEQVTNYINLMDRLMSSSGLIKSDDDLSELQTKSPVANYTTQELFIRNAVAKALNESGVTTKIFEDFQTVTKDILNIKAKLINLTSSGVTEAETPSALEEKKESLKNNVEVLVLNKKLKEAESKRDQILNGDRSDYYFGQAMYILSPALNESLSTIGLNNYTRSLYNKEFKNLSEEDQAFVTAKFKEYSSLDEKEKAFASYDIFSGINEQLSNNLISINERLKSNKFNQNDKDNNLVLNRIKDLEIEKYELDKKILTFAENNDLESEEYSETVKRLGEVDMLHKYYSSNPYLLASPELSDDSKKILNPEKENMNIDQYSENILLYYNHVLNNDGVIDPNVTDVRTLLKGIYSSFDFTALDEMFSEDGILNELRSKWLDENEDDYEGRAENSGIMINLDNTYELEFKNAIITFINSLNGTHEDVLNAHSDLVNYLKSHYFNDGEIKALLDLIIPTINGKTLIDFINEVKQLLGKSRKSSIYDLLQELYIKLNGESSKLIDVIKAEESRFINSDSLETYIIENTTVESELEDLYDYLEILSTIINAATTHDNDGFNANLNTERIRLNKEALAELSPNTGMHLINDLNILSNKLEMLLGLSRQNSERKLKVQKNITINMRKQFVNILISPTSLIKPKFEKEFDINIDEIWNKYNFNESVTLENYSQYEQNIIAFETEIFTQLNNKYSNEELADKLMSLFDINELYKQKSTKFTEKTDIVSDYDTLMYLASIVSYSSNNFYAKLKDIIVKEEFDKAPIFSQEYSVKLGYIMNKNRDLFNLLLFKISKVSIDDYTKNKSKLNNMYSVFGGAGTGKTTSVGLLLKLLLDSENSSFITLAPTNRQVVKLAESLNLTESKKFNKNDFIDKLLDGRLLSDSDIVEVEGTVVLKSDINITDSNLFDESENKILFIDEITHFSKPELELINKWARRNNVMIYAFGDLKQSKINYIVNNSKYTGGIEDSFRIQSPNLSTSLRPNVIAKNDNYVIINNMSELVQDQYQDNPEWDIRDLDNSTINVLKIAQKLVFYENAKAFVGEKFVESEEDIITYAKKFTSFSNDVVIITDDVQKYQTIENVKVIHVDEVQGNEFDYVLIDVRWGNNQPSSNLSKFYTLTQRSTKGSVILNYGISSTLNLATVYDATVNSDISISKKNIEDFKAWRLPSLEKINFIENSEFVENEKLQEEVHAEEISDSVIAKGVEEVKKNVGNISEVSQQTENTIDVTESPFVETNVEETITTPTEKVVSINEEPSSKLTEYPKNSKTSPLITDDRTYSYIDMQDILEYYGSTLTKEDLINPKSLLNALDLVEDGELNHKGGITFNNYPRIIATMNSYFTRKHTITELTDELSNLLSNTRNKTISHLRVALKEFEANPKYEIINYKNKGMMVANLTINGKLARIPLLITSINHVGKYNGKIEFHRVNKIKKTPNVTKSLVELNKKGFFKINSNVVILNMSDRHLIGNEFTERFITVNQGKAFAIITGDLLASDTLLSAQALPEVVEGKVAYLHKQDASFQLMGVQATGSINDVISNPKLLNKNRVGSIISSLLTKEGQLKDMTIDYLTSHLRRTGVGRIIKLPAGKNPIIQITLNFKADNRSILKMYTLSNVDNKIVISELINFKRGNTIGTAEPISTNNLMKQIKWILSENNLELNPDNVSIEFGNTSVNENGIESIFRTAPEKQIGHMFGSFTSDTSKTILDEYFNNIPKFKNGIYLEDVLTKTKIGGYWFKSDRDLHEYKTDADQISTDIFKIDLSKIDKSNNPNITTVSEQTQTKLEISSNIVPKTEKIIDPINKNIHIINKVLSENHIILPTNILNIQEEQKYVDAINEYLKTSSFNSSYKQIEIDKDNGVFIPSIKVIKDYNNLIKNLLNKHNIVFDNINILNDNNTLKLIPFYVSLENNSTGYYLTKQENVWNFVEFKSIGTYSQLLNKFNEINDVLSQDILSYITALINNIDISQEVADNYYNATLQDTDYALSELNVLVNNYLLNRLKNNEC